MSNHSIGYQVPLTILTGSTVDISPMLRFFWWEEVYYKLDDSSFPSDSTERKGHFVGIAEHVEHYMTFKILVDETRWVLYCSNVQSAEDPQTPNKLLDSLLTPSSKPVKDYIKGRDHLSDDCGEVMAQMPTFNTADLIEKMFLLPKNEDTGERFQARVISAINKHESDLAKDPERVIFRCSVNDDQYESIISYNDIMTCLNDDEDDSRVWKLRRITSHQGPLKNNDQMYKGSRYNVLIKWENGEITSEALSIFAADDPVTCVIYARDNDLLDKDRWQRFKGISKRQKKLLCLVNQARMRFYKYVPRYKCGYKVPRNGNYAHAKELDQKNGNMKWQDAVGLKREQVQEYSTFLDKGKGVNPPKGYKKITVHIVFDVKHDGRHKLVFWLVDTSHQCL